MTVTLAMTSTANGLFDSQALDGSRDSQLYARLRAGDPGAGAAVVREFGGRLLAVARRLLHCEEDSADAVQDAFLSAFRSLDQFEGKSSLGTWLHRIVVNSCLVKLRVKSRTRALPIDDVLPTFEKTGYSARANGTFEEQAFSQISREETRAQIRACIDRLPNPYRTVLVKRDIEEFDTEETALQLGIAPGAVKTRLHRARQALRTMLVPMVADEKL